MAKIDHRDWRSATFDGLCPTAIEWAQMAAYIDGEGSVLINTRGNQGNHESPSSRFYLKLTVANTDVRLPVWCKEHFGGSYKDANSEKYYEGKNWKRAYHWSCSSNRAAWIMYNCLPYFVMKRDQAEIGIQLQESMLAAHKFRSLPSDVVGERRELKKRLLILKARGVTIPVEQQERIDKVS